MERLFSFIQVCPKYNHKYPYKREVEGEIRHKDTQKKRQCEDGTEKGS